MSSDVVFAVPLVVFGALLVVGQAKTLRRALRSRGWPRVPGRVLATGVTRRPVLHYEYEVNGVRYLAQIESFRRVRRRAVRPFAMRYPAGTVVDVWYDPRDPARAVLEPGAGPVNLVGSVLGICLFVGGVMGMVALR